MSWDQPGHPPYMVCEPGTATRYGTDSPLANAFRCPSHHRASVRQDGGMAGDGDLRSFNPHPPLLHLHQTRRKTSASPEIRCLTNCLCGNSSLRTVLDVRSSGRCCKLFGEPPPSRSTNPPYIRGEAQPKKGAYTPSPNPIGLAPGRKLRRSPAAASPKSSCLMQTCSPSRIAARRAAFRMAFLM